MDTKGESKRGAVVTTGNKPLDMLIGSFRGTRSLNILIGSLRGTKSLSHHLPLPLIKGKGDKGGWGY